MDSVNKPGQNETGVNQMTSKRVFTDEELEQIGARTSDLVDAAIDSGDLGRAKKLNHRQNREFLEMHDLYLHWTAALLSHIYRSYGDEALYKALDDSFRTPFRPVVDAFKVSDTRKKVEMFARGLRGHLQPLKIVEDDEKVTIVMQPCGSGARLVQGKAYEPPMNLAKVVKAQKMTFGQKDFPVYCAHCSFHEILSLEWIGEPVLVMEPAAKSGEGSCRFHIYKDPRNIPARYYERFGKKKPQAG